MRSSTTPTGTQSSGWALASSSSQGPGRRVGDRAPRAPSRGRPAARPELLLEASPIAESEDFFLLHLRAPRVLHAPIRYARIPTTSRTWQSALSPPEDDPAHRFEPLERVLEATAIARVGELARIELRQ